VILTGLLTSGTARSFAQEPAPEKGAIVRETVIAGGLEDFMEVRHLVLAGSNESIGRTLATLAKERFRVEALASPEPLRTRVQRKYLERHYPILLERMRGVAAAFGKALEDDRWDFGGLPYLTGPPGGCSVVHYPPGMTTDGGSVVSRNYEFTTGDINDKWPKRGQLPATARPYLIEMHPDRGHASLALYSYDLLSGVIDGLNDQGLTVSVLTDFEIPNFPIEPAESAVGLNELEALRLLLDTCADTDEAMEALLSNKQYYTYMPQHYLIADRRGKAFVWEYSRAHNREYVIENPDKPLISTNFLLHEHLEGDRPPSSRGAKGVCQRYTALAKRTEEEQGEWSIDRIKQSHQAVDQTAPKILLGLIPPFRTLWHALYRPEQRSVSVSFYLGDEPDPDRPGKNRIVRSKYLAFTLEAPKGRGADGG
jgi:hypothetical protein